MRLVWLVLACCFSWAQELDELERLPDYMVDGSLLKHEAGFTIQAPDGWVWRGWKEQRDIFVAVQPLRGDKVAVDLIYRTGIEQPIESELPALLRNLTTMYEKRGYLLQDETRSKVPGTLDAWLITYKAQDDLGSRVFLHHYMVGLGDIFRIRSTTETEEVPIYLTEVLQGLRQTSVQGLTADNPANSGNNDGVIRAPEADEVEEANTPPPGNKASAETIERLERLAPSLYFVYIVLWLMVWGACSLLNKATGRQIDGHAVAIGFILLLGLLVTVMIGMRTGNASLMGRFASTMVIPMVLVVFIRQKQQKKQGQSPKGSGKKTTKNASIAEIAASEAGRGNRDKALSILRDNAPAEHSYEVWEQYLKLALAMRAPDDINMAGRNLITLAVKQGDQEAAIMWWDEITEKSPEVLLPHALANSLAAMLVAKERLSEASHILIGYLGRLQNPQASAMLTSVETLVKCDRVSAYTWMERLMTLSNLSARDEQRRADLKLRLSGSAAPPPIPGSAPNAPAPAAPAQAPPPAPTAIHDPTAPANRRLVAHQAVPTAMEASGLKLMFANKSQKLLPYASIKTLAVGLIRESGAKPYLLMDLLLSDLTHDADVRLLRFDSRQFSPQTLFPQASSGKEAFQQLANLLLQGSRANPLPSREGTLGQPYAAYTSASHMEQTLYGT